MDSGNTHDRATLNALADIANNKPIEGGPYKFWGMIHVFYCQTADNAVVLGSIPTPKNINQTGVFNSKATSWFSVSVGDIAINLQTNEAFRLVAHPITTFSNWTKLTTAEFVVNGPQPAGTLGKAWYASDGQELHFNTTGYHWRNLRIFRNGIWELYGGWMTELNRLRHSLHRALRNNDPAKQPTPAWIVEGLVSTGPWVLQGGIDGPFAGVSVAGGVAPGSFVVSEGGWGPNLLFDHRQAVGFPSGHQVSDVQVWWSDEVATTTTPQFRIAPQWSHRRVSADREGLDGDISGFRYEGPTPATFNAWMHSYTGGTGFDSTNLLCSHPGCIKEFRSHATVAIGQGPGVLYNFRQATVEAVRLEGTINPGEEFWIQTIFHVGLNHRVQGMRDDGGAVYNSLGEWKGEALRARFLPALHPEIDNVFIDMTRASIGEPFSLYMRPQLAAVSANTGVLHATKNFRTGLLQSTLSTYPFSDEDTRSAARIKSLGGQSGAMYIGFVDRFKDATAEVPQCVAFAGRTIPPIRMNVGQEDYRLLFAPLAKVLTPNPFTVDPTDPERLYDRITIPDNSTFYPYPCIRHDRTQTAIALPDPDVTNGRAALGMVYRVDVRRSPIELGDGVQGYTTGGSQTVLQVEIGVVTDGNFKTYSNVVLAAGENIKTQRVTFPTYGAPVAYKCDQDPNVFVTAMFVPPVRVHNQVGFFSFPTAYRTSDGHKWISPPPMAEDYNGIQAMLAKL